MAAFITGISQDAERVLLDFLAEALPAYMRPRTLFMLESLPLSISGKIDRNALKYLLNSRKKDVKMNNSQDPFMILNELPIKSQKEIFILFFKMF